jgi:hypothetical protein
MKGVKVRYIQSPSGSKFLNYYIEPELQFDATIPVVFAAYVTKIPDVQDYIAEEYKFQREGWIQSGYHEESLADIRNLITQIPKDTETELEDDAFRIYFSIRSVWDSKHTDTVIGIEGISVHADFSSADEVGFPQIIRKQLRQIDHIPDILDNIDAPNLPKWHMKELGDLQGLADL